MHRKKTLPPPPIELQQALDWLAEPPQTDPLLDLVPLRKHIAAIGMLGLPVLHRLKIDELLQLRAERIDEALHPMLFDIKLPPPERLGAVAQGLIGLRADLGETWRAVAEDVDSKELARVHRSQAQLCLRGIQNLSRQYITTLLIAIPTPFSLWRNVQTLYHSAHELVDPTNTLPAEIGTINIVFKAMLALAAAQPEGFTPREIVFISEYLETQAASIQIDIVAPDYAGDWFWLDATLDQAPVPLARLKPTQGRCLFFRFGRLAELATGHLKELNDGMPPASLGLPRQAAGADYRNALERARLCWSVPRQRSFNRRQQTMTVDVCTQLSSLWTALDIDFNSAPCSSVELTHGDWTVLNESPAGYAIVRVVGDISGILAGCAIGLRTGAGAAWQICLVRWARISNHVELGLEVLAPSATPVRIQALNRRVPESPIPALMLPAMPGLNRNEAILVGRGDYNVRPFTLLQEQEDSLQVVECVPNRSLIETSSIEVFEFSRNRIAN